MSLIPIDPIGWLPDSLKQQIIDSIVTSVADQAEKAGRGGLSQSLKQLRSDASFQRAVDQGLREATDRFVHEYMVEDKDLVTAIAHDPDFWKASSVRQALDDAFKFNFLKCTLDSGPWPCEYPGAQSVKVRVPEAPPIPRPELKPGVRVAEAELKTHELQDLADTLGDLGKAAAGYDLKFRVHIELGGNPPDDVVKQVNALLEEVSEALQVS